MDEHKNEGKNKTTLYCSFCGKSQHEVKKLIAGPTVFICDECVELCMDIIKEEHQSTITKNKEGIMYIRVNINIYSYFIIIFLIYYFVFCSNDIYFNLHLYNHV